MNARALLANVGIVAALAVAGLATIISTWPSDPAPARPVTSSAATTEADCGMTLSPQEIARRLDTARITGHAAC